MRPWRTRNNKKKGVSRHRTGFGHPQEREQKPNPILHPRFRKRSQNPPREKEEHPRRAVTPGYDRQGYEQPYSLYSPRKPQWRQGPKYKKNRPDQWAQDDGMEHRKYREVTRDGQQQLKHRKQPEIGYYPNDDLGEFQDREDRKPPKMGKRVTPVKRKRPNRWDRPPKSTELLYGGEDDFEETNRSNPKNKQITTRKSRSHYKTNKGGENSPNSRPKLPRYNEDLERSEPHLRRNFSARNMKHRGRIKEQEDEFMLTPRAEFLGTGGGMERFAHSFQEVGFDTLLGMPPSHRERGPLGPPPHYGQGPSGKGHCSCSRKKRNRKNFADLSLTNKKSLRDKDGGGRGREWITTAVNSEYVRPPPGAEALEVIGNQPSPLKRRFSKIRQEKYEITSCPFSQNPITLTFCQFPPPHFFEFELFSAFWSLIFLVKRLNYEAHTTRFFFANFLFQ